MDPFRIKIWDPSGTVISDNQMEEAENCDATTAPPRDAQRGDPACSQARNARTGSVRIGREAGTKHDANGATFSTTAADPTRKRVFTTREPVIIRFNTWTGAKDNR